MLYANSVSNDMYYISVLDTDDGVIQTIHSDELDGIVHSLAAKGIVIGGVSKKRYGSLDVYRKYFTNVNKFHSLLGEPLEPCDFEKYIFHRFENTLRLAFNGATVKYQSGSSSADTDACMFRKLYISDSEPLAGYSDSFLACCCEMLEDYHTIEQNVLVELSIARVDRYSGGCRFTKYRTISDVLILDGHGDWNIIAEIGGNRYNGWQIVQKYGHDFSSIYRDFPDVISCGKEDVIKRSNLDALTDELFFCFFRLLRENMKSITKLVTKRESKLGGSYMY